MYNTCRINFKHKLILKIYFYKCWKYNNLKIGAKGFIAMGTIGLRPRLNLIGTYWIIVCGIIKAFMSRVFSLLWFVSI